MAGAAILAGLTLIAASSSTSTSTAAAGKAVSAAARAIDELRVEDAIDILEDARARVRFSYEQHVQLYEQLGIAYAYQGRAREAIDAFRVMLAIDPQHALRYTLSPKVTLLFEEARKKAAAEGAPQLEVIWPRDLGVASPIPIDVEVIADPLSFLRVARIYVRRAGEARFVAHEVKLAGERVVLPAADPRAQAAVDVELYAVAIDARGNEVLRWASAERPRAIHLAYRAPPEWYEAWWAWTIAAVVVAAGASAAVYAATRTPSEEVGVTAVVRR